MCKRIDCPRCGKPSFTGCGAHVEQVLAGVPKAQRCRCAEEQATKPKTEARAGGGWLSNLFGGRR